MRLSRIKNTIIAALLGLAFGLLQGCSAVRLGYNNGPQLAWWWLDGYVDFSREQTPAAKEALARFFDWHRATQLPDYLALLAQAQVAVLEPTTPALACRWQTQIRERLEPSLEQAIALAADQLPGLGEAQFRSIDKRFAKVRDDMKSDFLQPDPQDRLNEAVKRTLERAERLYGALDEAQKKVVRDQVAASPFNPEAWLVERTKRQRETVQTLRRLVAEQADRDQRVAALRALAVRAERSPDPGYRAYQLKLTDYNCGFAAAVHNATTPAQKRKARDTLKGYEDDLRSLIAAE